MIKILDNALNDSLLTSIKERINARGFPWYFIENSAYPDDKELIKQTQFNYSFYNENEMRDPALFDMTNSISDILKDLLELEKTYNVFRLRWGMTTTLNKMHKNTPHIDMQIPHKVILFYLNDCDGDTYFYDNEHKIIDSVTPKENRAILFDGLIPHSSSKPIKFSRRIILNINLADKKYL